jgi:hypothetical protein
MVIARASSDGDKRGQDFANLLRRILRRHQAPPTSERACPDGRAPPALDTAQEVSKPNLRDYRYARHRCKGGSAPSAGSLISPPIALFPQPGRAASTESYIPAERRLRRRQHSGRPPDGHQRVPDGLGRARATGLRVHPDRRHLHQRRRQRRLPSGLARGSAAPAPAGAASSSPEGGLRSLRPCTGCAPTAANCSGIDLFLAPASPTSGAHGLRKSQKEGA